QPASDRSAPSTEGETASASSAMAWVIPKKLAVGRLPRSSDLLTLQNQGIQTILSLCRSSEGALPPETPEQFQLITCPLPDQRHPDSLTVKQLGQAVKVVEQELQFGRPVYVHCFAGLERSPTVCLTYLCQSQNAEIWEALQFLKEVYPAACPSSEQLRVAQIYLQSRRNLMQS
ncbi:MAG: dual specificity protein phosphatase, partial [Prochlorothrix sp.]|nr:dual specificity protein phosphatase [Prochlorothrix sp.]